MTAELRVNVEWPCGSVRTGVGPDGPWSREMSAHYGEVPGTIGADGDPLDVYVNPTYVDSADVYVVTQVDPKTGKFDEEKVMVGYPDRWKAEAAYRAHYPNGGAAVFGGIRRMTQPEFVDRYDVLRVAIRESVGLAVP